MRGTMKRVIADIRRTTGALIRRGIDVKGIQHRLMLILALATWPAYSQTTNIDSLKRLVLKTQSGSSERVRQLNKLALAYVPTDMADAFQTAMEAEREAQSTGEPRDQAWAGLTHTICLVTAGETSAADGKILDLLDLAGQVKGDNFKSYLHTTLANLLRDRGFFDSARYHYRFAMNVLENRGDAEFPVIHDLERTRFHLARLDPDSALMVLDGTFRRPGLRTDRSLLREAFVTRARAACHLYRYESAEQDLGKALELSEPNTMAWLRAQIVKGEIRHRQGDYPGAMEIWVKLLDVGKGFGYKYEQANLLQLIGESYEEQGFYKVADHYLKSSLSISERSGFLFLKGEALVELGWIAQRSKRFREAMHYAAEAETEMRRNKMTLRIAGLDNLRGMVMMEQRKFDSAMFYHMRSLKARQRLGNQAAISASLFNLGDLYNRTGQYQSALAILRRGMKIDEAIGDRHGMSMYYHQMGKNLNALGRYDSVAYFLKKAISMAAPNSSYEILQKSYFEMADYLKKTGQTAGAMSYLEKYVSLRDSLYNKESAQSVAAYETLFDVDKKEQQLQLLRKDQELGSANSRIQEFWLLVLSASLLVLVLMALIYYRIGARLRRLNRANTDKAEELRQANDSLRGLYLDLQRNNDELRQTLSRLEQAQVQLLRSEKMASLGVLAAGIAHELNNPLNFIRGGVSTLEIKLDQVGHLSGSEGREYLKIIQEGVTRASAILGGLGQYSRQTDHMTESCRIHSILDNCLVILGNSLKHHVRVQKNYSPFELVVTGNEGKLHQAFINVISNAEQAIVGKGTIWITTEVREGKGVIAIRDSGSGISETNLKRLGDLFFTTKAPGKGTGLGLSITYKIVEEHGGRIDVTSQVGEGAEFRFTFPLPS